MSYGTSIKRIDKHGLPQLKGGTDRITQDNHALIVSPGSYIFFGAHVDHLATRSIAERLTNRRIVYYEDFPYAARTVRLSNAQAFLAARGFRRHSLSATPKMIEEQLRLYNLYDSQRQDHHVAQIQAYLQARGFGLWGTVA